MARLGAAFKTSSSTVLLHVGGVQLQFSGSSTCAAVVVLAIVVVLLTIVVVLLAVVVVLLTIVLTIVVVLPVVSLIFEVVLRLSVDKPGCEQHGQ